MPNKPREASRIPRVTVLLGVAGVIVAGRGGHTLKVAGNSREQPAMDSRYLIRGQGAQERIMPILVMWAVPAVIVIGGVGYWLVHMH
jgi:hypothetical protein